MEIVCIGGGVSSCIFAYNLKKNHPDYNITILEASDKILKRILVSGNGRCNFFNSEFLKPELLVNKVSNYKEFNRFFDKDLAKEFLAFLSSEFNFKYYEDDCNRMYPFSNISSSLKEVIEQGLNRLKVKIKLNTKVKSIDLVSKKIISNNGEYKYDKVFIGVGGKSYDRESKDYDLFISSLKLPISNYSSGLTPIVVSKNIPTYLVGTRLKGQLTLKRNRSTIYQEEGEILFKKDGLSGICVFNASLFIDLNSKDSYFISFNPFIHDNVDVSFSSRVKLEELYGLFNPNLIKYISSLKKNVYTSKDILDLLTFHVINKYPLKDSQISLGGILTSSIDSSFSLKDNKDTYLGGEILDLHGICGGFNMGMAFLSGFKASKSIK